MNARAFMVKFMGNQHQGEHLKSTMACIDARLFSACGGMLANLN